MAKHGEKKLNFNFSDIELAAFFLDFIRRKKFYVRIGGSMNHTGKLTIKINGPPENIILAVAKIKRLYRSALDKYREQENLVQISSELDTEYDELFSDETSSDREPEFNLKLKKF